MKIRLHRVDAFASEVFRGNPAAVCPLERWLPEGVLQAIAAENNASETAFLVPRGGGFDIRWFTPAMEVDLCGHATLASAHVVLGGDPKREEVRFSSRSGPLRVTRDGERLRLDLPLREPARCGPAPPLELALGARLSELWAAVDYLAVLGSEEEVRSLAPDMGRLSALDRTCVIVTAPGRGCDFVCRVFAPAEGIPEDPVTGSAHCTLVPYWSRRLAKRRLHAVQVSRRGGELSCELAGDRVLISGRAVTYLVGEIDLPGAVSRTAAAPPAPARGCGGTRGASRSGSPPAPRRRRRSGP